jgi:hypothetical protein
MGLSFQQIRSLAQAGCAETKVLGQFQNGQPALTVDTTPLQLNIVRPGLASTLAEPFDDEGL